MEETIGIVLTSRTEEEIRGELAETKVELVLEEDGLMRVKQIIIRTSFYLDTNSNILTLAVGARCETGIEIAKRLTEIGYENIKFIFNDREIEY